MIIIGLTQQVNTDAELTALTGMADQLIVWHNGNACGYMYRTNAATGDLSPDTGGGWWVKEKLPGLNLEEYKTCRYKEIDDRTGQLVLNGFSYASKVFSLSINAQINIEALNSSRNNPALTYPISYSTLDDGAHYDVVDATDLHNMYLTALATKKSHVDTGTALKDSIPAAVDEAAVSAVIDNR